MLFKNPYIYCFFIIVLASQITFGQTEYADKVTPDASIQQTDWRIENLMKQARELMEAYDKGEIDKFIALSHPKIWEKDSAANFFDEVKLVLTVNSELYELLPSSVESPKELFELLIDKRLFAVVPYKLEAVSNNKKNKIVALGSMVGISEDGGKNWKFAKGIAFNEAFPDVAGMFSIPYPVEKRFVDGKEQ